MERLDVVKARVLQLIETTFRATRRSLRIWTWKRRGYAPPAPDLVKWATLLRHGGACPEWIESGTYFGDTSLMLAEHGCRVVTIEPEPGLAARAERRFRDDARVDVVRGLSEEVLPGLLDRTGPVLAVWLDGHYSAGVTHQGPQDTPIRFEIDAISTRLERFERLVVFVDDVRCFDPGIDSYSTYPPREYLVEWACAHGLWWTIEHDIFIAVKGERV